MLKIAKILHSLAEQRPIFHSEADFQHALAWELHRKLPGSSVRLEFPVRVKNHVCYIDIWIIYRGSVLAFEVKYKTRSLFTQIGNEQYHLKDQGSQDLGRYDFLRDVWRLEQVSDQYQSFTGYAILLTNDSTYWKRTKLETIDSSFRLHDGREIEGVLDWGSQASDGTKKNREQVIELRGKYRLSWTFYSHPSYGRHGEFCSLVVKVKAG